MSKCKYIKTTLSPLKRRVTIRKHSLKGWIIYRGGKDVISDRPMQDKAEAEEFARKYCDYWGDEYGGFEGDEA